MTSVFQISKAQWNGQRKGQEDSCDFRILTAPPGNGSIGGALSGERIIAVLADGMGGHVGGRLASSLASAKFLDSFCRGSEQLDERFSIAVEQSNSTIAQEVAQNADLKGMGCTLIGAYLDGRMLRWISVGDSIIYVYHRQGGWIEKVNDDHSMAPILRKAVERGELSEAEAQNHPHRNALRSALTGGQIPLVDPGLKVELSPGDVVVLASDGLLSLTKTDVARVIGDNLLYGANVIADALLREVQSKGRPDQDNTSVIVAMLFDDAASEKTVRLYSRVRPKQQLPIPIGRLALSGVVAAMLLVAVAGLAALLVSEPEGAVTKTPSEATAVGDTSSAADKSGSEAAKSGDSAASTIDPKKEKKKAKEAKVEPDKAPAAAPPVTKPTAPPATDAAKPAKPTSKPVESKPAVATPAPTASSVPPNGSEAAPAAPRKPAKADEAIPPVQLSPSGQ